MLHPRQFAQDTPHRPAYIMGGSGEVVSYGKLEERANQCAHLLRDAGLKTGDHIALFTENNIHYLEICCGAQRAGLYYTAISIHLTPSEIQYIVNDCQARLFITSNARSEVASRLLDQMPNVTTRLMVDGTVEGYEAYEQRRSRYPSTPIEDECEGQDMLYSSGTTGRPKGIVPPFLGNPIGEVDPKLLGFFQLFGFGPDSVYLSPAPLYHSAPLRFCMYVLRFGGTAVVMEKFDALKALELMETHRVTHSQWVPTMFIRMLKLPRDVRDKFDLSSLKVAIHAAAPIPIPVKEQMIDWWGPIFFEYYGATEANGIAMIDSEDWLSHKGSVGKAVLGVPHILDDSGMECPMGEPGVIYFEDGNPFEYHNDPDKTAESFTAQGWTTVGDIGYLDEEGYLYLTDRKANMIISGGVNIYPQEAENVLVTHPQVVDAAVFGVPDKEFGEQVKAVVQLKDPAKAGLEMERELMEFCQGHLSKIKCPVSVDFEPELPRTPAGKLFKRLLRERYWKDHAGSGEKGDPRQRII